MRLLLPRPELREFRRQPLRQGRIDRDRLFLGHPVPRFDNHFFKVGAVSRIGLASRDATVSVKS